MNQSKNLKVIALDKRYVLYPLPNRQATQLQRNCGAISNDECAQAFHHRQSIARTHVHSTHSRSHPHHNNHHSIPPNIILSPLLHILTSPTIPTNPSTTNTPPPLLIFPPQRRQPLLLRNRIDIRAHHKGQHVEERHPRLLREEGLRERQSHGRADPRDAHDGPEAGADGGAHLVEGAGAGDEGHAD